MAKKLAQHGYQSETLLKAINSGVAAMVANDGSRTNEEVFWDSFCALLGEEKRKDLPLFEEFYEKVENNCDETNACSISHHAYIF